MCVLYYFLWICAIYFILGRVWFNFTVLVCSDITRPLYCDHIASLYFGGLDLEETGQFFVESKPDCGDFILSSLVDAVSVLHNHHTQFAISSRCTQLIKHLKVFNILLHSISVDPIFQTYSAVFMLLLSCINHFIAIFTVIWLQSMCWNSPSICLQWFKLLLVDLVQ